MGERADTKELEQTSTRINPMDLIASTILKHVNQPESSSERRGGHFHDEKDPTRKLAGFSRGGRTI